MSSFVQNLDRFLSPKKIAVVGASDKPDSVAGAVFRNIQQTHKHTLYPVNPAYETVGGVQAYKKLTDLPESPDAVMIATPVSTVPGILRDAVTKEVGGIAILTSGYSETGSEGTKLAKELLDITQPAKIPLLGPNCLGFMRPHQGLNATFARTSAHPGKIAFISQSGALCTAILDWANKNYVGFSAFVSIGDMTDIGFDTMIDYFAKDSQTGSIVLYMESLTRARSFLSAARAASRIKPVIVLKSGKSSEGTQAARSHTGSLAGNDRIFDAAFKRAGMLRVKTIGELFDSAETLDMQRLPAGPGLAIVTNAGGPGVIATDALIEQGGQLAQLTEHTTTQLREVLPAAASVSNPVDILGDATPERYKQAVELCLNDPNVHGVLVILTPQKMTHPVAVAQALTPLAKLYDKSILASWMGEGDVDDGRQLLEQARIPVYRTPEHGTRSFVNMSRYKKNLNLLYETPATIPHAFRPNKDAVKAIIQKAGEYRENLTEHEAKQVLEAYEIPTAHGSIAHSPEEAANIASTIGFPVVLKISSPDILHKTEVHGQVVGIDSIEAAKTAYTSIIQSVTSAIPNAQIEGILVEKMMAKKYELLIGCKKDPIFGPAIVFGMGGIAVDVFADTTVGLPPLNMALALRLIEDTKIYRLLKGYRNMPGVDIEAIQYLLYKFAYLVSDFPEFAEIDINPFGVDEHGGAVLDAKIILDREVIKKPIADYAHMSISPYPAEYIKQAKLDNGIELTLRPIRPEDEPLEAELINTFSKETQRFRFFGYVSVSHDMLVRYTQIDYDREIAIVAISHIDGVKKMLGVTRIIADAFSESAEFAIAVGDPWQGQGLGTILMEYVLEIAKKRSIKKIFAHVLADNAIMIKLLDEQSFKMTRNGEEVYAEKML